MSEEGKEEEAMNEHEKHAEEGKGRRVIRGDSFNLKLKNIYVSPSKIVPRPSYLKSMWGPHI